MAPADEISKVAADLCKRFPQHPSRTLARKLVDATNGAITMEAARSRIRQNFGAKSKKNRRQAKFRRPLRKPGEGVPMPPSVAKPWSPAVMEITGLVGIISDVHIPYHSELALSTAIGFLRDCEIDALLINGDLCDFYSISRWTKNPSQRNFAAELKACRQTIEWLRGQFPDIPIVMKAGNHEERWDHWIWQHAPEISEEGEMSLPTWLRLEQHNVEWVSDQRPVMVGQLPVCHGHELPRGLAAPVNVARGAFLRTLSTVLVGHSHRTSGHAETDLWHDEIFCWSTGCLCDMNPEYARVNKWNHGFATVRVGDNGSFNVENYRISKKGEVRSS
jgi:predicted phosphodiesterase